MNSPRYQTIVMSAFSNIICLKVGNHDFDNLTSTPQGLDMQRYALITFCFTRVSCDIQIHQLINDIKCASALADCVTLCRSATVINIRMFELKPLPTFLHNFIMFGYSVPAYF